MGVRVGDIFIGSLDGETYLVEKVVDEMAMLRSKDGRKEIVTDVGSLNSPGWKKVNRIETHSERRKDKRYLLRDEATVLIDNDNIIIAGRVRDMSMGGLSLEYPELTSKRRMHQDVLELTLSLSSGDFSWPGVPC